MAKTKTFEEWYGELMQITTISGKKNKNLQYLTNELFKAAKEDLRKGSSRESLDNFIEVFGEKLGVRKIDKQSQNYTTLVENYNQLKDQLQDVRVFGVGKSIPEKAYTLGCNCLTSIGRVLGAAGAVVAFGAGVTATAATGFFLLPIITPLTAKAVQVSLGAATANSLGDTRKALKKNLMTLMDAPDDGRVPTKAPRTLLQTKKLWKKTDNQKLT